MKVQLVVVRGKPEGKVIPLVGPNFKIGRGETCHLRPNSEQVSREHAEFTIDADSVMVRDLGQSQRYAGQRQGADGRVPAEGSRPGAGGAAHLRRLDRGGARCRGQGGRRAARPPAVAKAKPRRMTSPATRSTPGCSARTPGPPPRARPSTAATPSRSPPSRTPRPRPPPSRSLRRRPATTSTSARPRRRSRWTRRPRPPTTSRARASTEDVRRRDRRGRRGRRGRPRRGRRGGPRGVHRRVQPVLRRQEGPEGAGQAGPGPAKPSFKDTSDAANDILRRLMERRRASKSASIASPIVGRSVAASAAPTVARTVT